LQNAWSDHRHLDIVITPGNGSAAVAFDVHAPEEIVQSGRYFHPELGYFCPAPRLRRELRVACYAGLFGVAVGAAIVVVALSWTDRTAVSASPLISAPTQPAVDAVPRQLASTERNDLPKPAATQASQGETMQRTPTRPHELFAIEASPEPGRGRASTSPV
jgi:hypothetical protein